MEWVTHEPPKESHPDFSGGFFYAKLNFITFNSFRICAQFRVLNSSRVRSKNARIFATRSKQMILLASRARKGSPIFSKSFALRKWETCTDSVRIETPGRGAQISYNVYMKKIFLVVLVLLIGFGVWYMFKQTSPVSTYNSNTSSSQPDASNATFIFDDETITLKKGSNSISIVPGGEMTQDTTLTDIISYGDINGDKKNDAVVILVQAGGGSGVFVYIALYVSGPLNYKGSNTVFVGDRVEPKSISIDNGVITFKYLDRKPNEPYAAEPTVLTTKQFVYTKGALVEK